MTRLNGSFKTKTKMKKKTIYVFLLGTGEGVQLFIFLLNNIALCALNLIFTFCYIIFKFTHFSRKIGNHRNNIILTNVQWHLLRNLSFDCRDDKCS